MRSIERRFIEKKLKHPYHGAYIHLAKAVRGQKFSRKSLVKAFRKLIPIKEYAKSETLELIGYLELVTNSPEEVENGSKNRLGETKTQHVKH
jgi:hypothetical protein